MHIRRPFTHSCERNVVDVYSSTCKCQWIAYKCQNWDRDNICDIYISAMCKFSARAYITERNKEELRHSRRKEMPRNRTGSRSWILTDGTNDSARSVRLSYLSGLRISTFQTQPQHAEEYLL